MPKIDRLEIDLFRLPVMSHGAHDLHIHLLAAAPNAACLEWHAFGLDKFMEDPLTVDNGHARAPDRPGHGIVLDWQALAAHRPGQALELWMGLPAKHGCNSSF